jgi:uncharacterized protein YbjT (DUF2867 family)
MTILITGGNGTVSSALLEALPSSADVRVLVRDPAKSLTRTDVEVVVGDLDDPATLPPAFAGVDTVWLLNAMGPQAPHASMNAVHAAKEAGVRHVVRMSAIGAAHDAPTRNGRLHALSDIELMASGMDWTIIRPHFFMQNLLGSVAGDTLYGIVGDGSLALIDVRDIAEFAAHVLLAPASHSNKIYTLTGPNSLNMREAAAILSSGLATHITYQPVFGPDARQAMIDAGIQAWVADVSLEYGEAYARGWGDFTTTDFPDVCGRPARLFRHFVRDHTSLLSGV